MRRTALIAAILLGQPLLAHAAIVNGTFAGTALDGQDTTGVFGSPNPNLMNAAITGSYSIDTSLLSSSLSGTTDTYTGSPGALTVTVTINGMSYTFTDPTDSTIVLDSGAGEVSLGASNFVDAVSEHFSLDAFFGGGVITDSTDPTLGFSGTPTSSEGHFVIYDGAGSTAAAVDFTANALANGEPVPEPASLVLLLAAAGGVIAQRRRSRRAPLS